MNFRKFLDALHVSLKSDEILWERITNIFMFARSSVRFYTCTKQLFGHLEGFWNIFNVVLKMGSENSAIFKIWENNSHFVFTQMYILITSDRIVFKIKNIYRQFCESVQITKLNFSVFFFFWNWYLWCYNAENFVAPVSRETTLYT